MKGIGEIITQQQLESLKRYAAQSASATGYVAPTFYRTTTNANFAGINCYKDMATAFKQLAYLYNMPGYAKQTPVTTYRPPGTAPATLGINVDFFILWGNGGFINVPYLWVKEQINKPVFQCVVRFTLPNGGSTVYYGIFDNRYQGISATKVANVAPEKLAELDAFHREVQLLKYRYNALAIFISDLAAQPFNPTRQQSINRANILLTNMANDIRQIKGITLTFSNGQVQGIGLAPLVIIAIIALLGATAAWTITAIATEKQKTKRINDAYDVQKFIATENARIMADPSLTQQQKDALIATNNKTAAAAQKIADDANKPTPGIFDKLQNLAMIGAAFFLGALILKRNNNG